MFQSWRCAGNSGRRWRAAALPANGSAAPAAAQPGLPVHPEARRRKQDKSLCRFPGRCSLGAGGHVKAATSADAAPPAARTAAGYGESGAAGAVETPESSDAAVSSGSSGGNGSKRTPASRRPERVPVPPRTAGPRLLAASHHSAMAHPAADSNVGARVPDPTNALKFFVFAEFFSAKP